MPELANDLNKSFKDRERWTTTLLVEACSSLNADMVEVLLRSPEVDVSKLDGYGRTPLLRTLWNSEISIIV